jgi:hypothetical protein
LNRGLIAGLVLAGFASGILSVISLEVFSNIPQLEPFRLGLYLPGAIFGVIVWAYYAIFSGVRSWVTLLALIAACIGAYFSAVQLTASEIVDFRLLGDSSFYVSIFLSGMVGAFLVLAAAQFLLATNRRWKTILNAALRWSLAGGALGVAGWTLGGSLGKVLWLALHAVHLTASDLSFEAAVRNQTVNLFSLFALWQACMAALLGWLIAKSSAPQSKRNAAASA